MSKKIVVVGGGFGGVYTAKYLLKKGYKVLLVSEQNYFTFTPLLHEVATGSLIQHDVTFEFESFFKSRMFEFVRGHVESVDPKKRVVKTKEDELSYDYLVLATGSRTHTHKIQGVQHALELKNIIDAMAIKHAVVSLAHKREAINLTVVGGGPTGVELVFELDRLLVSLKRKHPRLKWSLRIIHSREHFCGPDSSPVARHIAHLMKQRHIQPVVNAYAEVVTPTTVQTTAGTFDSDVTILVAGVRPNTDFIKGVFERDERAFLLIDAYGRVSGHSEVFALGDMANFEIPEIPQLAQTAVQQACVVADNIDRTVKKQDLRVMKMNIRGMLFSLGYGNGVGQIGPWTVKGVLAWYLWRTVYLFKTPGLANKLRVAFSWTIGLFQGRNLSEL